MPKVGNTKFSYTKAGTKAAKAASKKTGKPMVSTGPAKGGKKK